MMSDTNVVAEAVINKVFNESQKVVNMNITSTSNIGIAAVLTGLTAFFVAGFRNDFDLCQELTPVYQKKIMPSVSREEYENYSYILNDSYIKFRDAAIRYQNQSEDWVTQMMSEFGEMMLVMLRANATDYSRGLMIDEAQKLLDIARKTGTEYPYSKQVTSANTNTMKEKESDAPDEKSIKKGSIAGTVAFVLFLLVCGVYYYITSVQSMYTPRAALYYMQDYYDDGYMDCYISVEPGDEKNSNMGTFSIYMLDVSKDSDDGMPRAIYMTKTRCGYWEWKKLLGSFATNNDGKRFGVIPSGYSRVDCYMADGTAVGFDSDMNPLEPDTIPAVREVIDFGTNNFIYEGTLYNEVNPNQLDENTLLVLSVLELRMNEVLGETE